MSPPQLTLASASPRRAALLRQIGISFEIRPSHLPEQLLAHESAADYVQRLARSKAKAVQSGRLPALGADTTVELNGHILEKPQNREQALAMLTQLQGTHHTVLTGVSICNRTREKTVLARAEVVFRRTEVEELQKYWQSGEPIDKAGAYGIQGIGAIFIAGICGQPSTVAGLPLVETNQLLCEFDIDVWQHRHARLNADR